MLLCGLMVVNSFWPDRIFRQGEVNAAYAVLGTVTVATVVVLTDTDVA
jgi:hypothetical protein